MPPAAWPTRRRPAQLATSKVANAMAKLAPNAQAFVNAVLAQAGAWRALKLDVQNRCSPGSVHSFTTMSPGDPAGPAPGSRVQRAC
jgi:hypothetical protein